MNKETFLRLVPTQTYNKNQEKSIIFLQDLQSKVVIGTQKLTKIEKELLKASKTYSKNLLKHIF